MKPEIKQLEALNSYVDWVRDAHRNGELEKCAGEHCKTMDHAAKWKKLCAFLKIKEDSNPFAVVGLIETHQHKGYDYAKLK